MKGARGHKTSSGRSTDVWLACGFVNCPKEEDQGDGAEASSRAMRQWLGEQWSRWSKEQQNLEIDRAAWFIGGFLDSEASEVKDIMISVFDEEFGFHPSLKIEKGELTSSSSVARMLEEEE